jgi:hypothetical protein
MAKKREVVSVSKIIGRVAAYQGNVSFAKGIVIPDTGSGTKC